MFKNGNHHYGIYHYANQGIISWYDFAVAIKKLAKLPCEILLRAMIRIIRNDEIWRYS